MAGIMVKDDPLNRLNSIISEKTSIDDIFTHLTVPQIQKLNREYKQNVSNAKNELHALVGSKYRDLIEIAEDISSMYAVTSEVDQSLLNLSYKQSRFVKFSGSNAASNYNSFIRKQEASEARKAEKLTILKNVINNQLTSFEIKVLSSRQRPPLRNTANYIYYAKCFYTLETIFKDTLSTEKQLSDKLTAFKSSFLAFLRERLSSYNVFSLSSYSNSASEYRPSQNLVWENLFTGQNIYLADDDFNVYDEDENEDNLQDIDYTEEADIEEGLHETYNKNTSPIINYLVAYIILNHNNEKLNTLDKIRDNFVSLRYDFLDSLFKKILSTAEPQNISHVNFYKAFKYIENTCDYVSKYFDTSKPAKNELFKTLKQTTGSWKASSLIGFRNWFEVDDIKFELDLILSHSGDQSSEVTVSSLNKFPLLLSSFCDALIKLISDNSNSWLTDLSHVFVIFHNFIICLKKLEFFMISNGSSSKLIDVLSKSTQNDKTIAVCLLDSVILKTSDVYTTHLKGLTNESKIGKDDSILSVIKLNLSNRDFNAETTDAGLFTSNFVETIDHDLDLYIDKVAQITSLPPMSNVQKDVCHQINIWFDSYAEYNALISFENASDWSLLAPRNCLSHLSDVLSRNKTNVSGKWGNFSRDLLLNNFKELTISIDKDLHTKIDFLVKEIGESVQDYQNSNDLEALYYLLRILVTLLDRMTKLNKEASNKDSLSKPISVMSQLCKDITKSIVSIIPNVEAKNNQSFLDSFDKFVDKLLECQDNEQSSEIPSRPSLRLSSLMFHLSSTYLSPNSSDYSKDYSSCKIFLNQHISEMFIEAKNKWILEDLIQKRIIDKLASYSSSQIVKDDLEIEPENKESSTVHNEEQDKFVISKEKILLIFTNVIYLLQFTNDSPVHEIPNTCIQDVCKKINEATQNTLILDDLSVKLAAKNIGEFYKSNRGFYLPLLIS